MFSQIRNDKIFDKFLFREMMNCELGRIQAKFSISLYYVSPKFNTKGNDLQIGKFEQNVKLSLHLYCLLEVTEFFMNDEFSYIEKVNFCKSVFHGFSITQNLPSPAVSSTLHTDYVSAWL